MKKVLIIVGIVVVLGIVAWWIWWGAAVSDANDQYNDAMNQLNNMNY